MISVTVKIDSEIEVNVIGHASYAEIGKDIVCAGVSSLVNALESHNKDARSTVQSGYASIILPNNKLTYDEVMMFTDGIKCIQEEFPEYIKLII